jgi:putative membrane protein
MRHENFFHDDAKRRAAQAVKAVETQTSAELVIAARPRSGKYEVVAYNFGFAALGTVTLLLVVLPRVYSIGAIALDGLIAFALAALLCANVDALTYVLTRPKTRQSFVDLAARAAFFDLGVSRTTGRNGILVFVSIFERTLTVLTDVGIDKAALGGAWTEAVSAMQVAVRQGNFDAFIANVERLGPVLGTRMPRAADDVNELPDEVQ